MLLRYARVSTQDQNLELQRDALTKAGCQKIFEDKLSGAHADRPGLSKIAEMLRKGDTFADVPIVGPAPYHVCGSGSIDGSTWMSTHSTLPPSEVPPSQVPPSAQPMKTQG